MTVGDGLAELLEKHGPVVNMRCMWEDLIFTASPNHIKKILATDFQNYVKGTLLILLRVRQEILDRVGPSRRPDYADIKDMKYLCAVINGVYLQSLRIPFSDIRE
jgi:hypothetical protein